MVSVCCLFCMFTRIPEKMIQFAHHFQLGDKKSQLVVKYHPLLAHRIHVGKMSVNIPVPWTLWVVFF